jgi:hypothetical protein
MRTPPSGQHYHDSWRSTIVNLLMRFMQCATSILRSEIRIHESTLPIPPSAFRN